MTDFAIVGHIAIDEKILRHEMRTDLGGPPTYISLAAEIFDNKIDVRTKVGFDMPDPFLNRLRGLGINLDHSVAPYSETTRFVLDYRREGRHLKVVSICEQIMPQDLKGIPDVVLITPIIGEVSNNAISVIKAGMIVLDPQGFVRHRNPNGFIVLKPWLDEALIRRTTILKSSESELSFITGEIDLTRGMYKLLKLGVEVVIVTKGEKGALMLTDSGLFKIPVFESKKVSDPTGAGDVFIGGFLCEYLSGEDPLWCASAGAAIASCNVETLGASLDASVKEVRRRSQYIYNRAKKI
jgi:sugar/nucleoside kinase (ribokinase family)